MKDMRKRILPEGFCPADGQKGSMKGISLSINMIVVLALALIILMALSAFFLTGSGRGITRAEAEKTFSLACTSTCGAGTDWKTQVVRLYSDNSVSSNNLYQACIVLGYTPSGDENDPEVRMGGILSCLNNCGNCGIDRGDTQGDVDNIGSIASGGLK